MELVGPGLDLFIPDSSKQISLQVARHLMVQLFLDCRQAREGTLESREHVTN